ncbi:unnamed protein product [Ixodes persulcatus]
MGVASLSAFLETPRGTKSHKSAQMFEPHLLSMPNLLDVPAVSRTPGTPSSAPSSAPPVHGAPPEKAKTPGAETKVPALIPRQRLLYLIVEDKTLTLYLYNWTSELGQELSRLLLQLAEWQDLRGDLLRSLTCQKMGVFFNQPLGRPPPPRATDPEPLCPRSQSFHSQLSTTAPSQPAPVSTPSNLLSFLNHVILWHNPPNRHPESSATHATRLALLAQVGQVLRGARPRCPMQQASYGALDDPVTRHGRQAQELRGLRRKELVEFQKIYNDKGTCANLLVMDKMLNQVKKEARLVHYCLTPLLFSPTWRLKVAQVRDHTLEPHASIFDISGQQDPAFNQRGNRSLCDVAGHGFTRCGFTKSGASSQRMFHVKNIRRHLRHCIACLAVTAGRQWRNSTRVSANRQRHPSQRRHVLVSRSLRDAVARTAGDSDATQTALRGFNDVWRGKAPASSSRQYRLGTPRPKFAFFRLATDFLRFSRTARFRPVQPSALMYVHFKMWIQFFFFSSVYGPHLENWPSNREKIVRPLHEFIRYLLTFFFRKIDTYLGVNMVCTTLACFSSFFVGSLTGKFLQFTGLFPCLRPSRTKPLQDTEYALVEISNKKVSYRDANDIQQTDNFFVGILTIHDTSPAFVEHGVLALGFYILLTSQRELFPKFTSAGPLASSASLEGQDENAEGCFRPVRASTLTAGGSQPASGGPSRRSSQTSFVAPDRSRLPQLVVSPEDANVTIGIPSVSSSGSIASSIAGGTRSRKGSFRGICEEEVAYLGYYSSHETLMQKVMSEQAASVAEHLRAVVAKASLHCRRDYLWKCLTCRHKASDDTSAGTRENTVRPTLSYTELTELLGYVEMAPLDEADPQLKPLMSMHFAWYQGLLRVLVMRYSENHSLFTSPDGSIHHLVVMSPTCADSFMLLTTNAQTSRAELRLVHRDAASTERTGADKSSSGLSTLHSLVEEFVSTCCFHLWAGLLC